MIKIEISGVPARRRLANSYLKCKTVNVDIESTFCTEGFQFVEPYGRKFWRNSSISPYYNCDRVRPLARRYESKMVRHTHSIQPEVPDRRITLIMLRSGLKYVEHRHPFCIALHQYSTKPWDSHMPSHKWEIPVTSSRDRKVSGVPEMM